MKGLLLPAIALGAVSVSVLVVGGGGCKAKKELIDRPETLEALKNCEDSAAASKKLIESYGTELRKMESASGAVELVVTIEGEIKPARPGASQVAVDTKAAAAQSQNFIDIVQKSRGAIQKCYEQALKKDTNLQARTVTLNVSASFSAGGQFQRTSFAPVISEAFDSCLRAVAAKWALPSSTQAMTFKAQVSLTPS